MAHLEAGAATLHTAKQQGCYLQLLASPRARSYYAALLRMRLAATLLAASAAHYLEEGQERAAIAACAARATAAWEGHSSALRAACYKAAAACDQDASALEAAAVGLVRALEAEAPRACWQEGRCVLSLLPVEGCGLPTCEWGQDARVACVLMANLFSHIDDGGKTFSNSFDH